MNLQQTFSKPDSLSRFSSLVHNIPDPQHLPSQAPPPHALDLSGQSKALLEIPTARFLSMKLAMQTREQVIQILTDYPRLVNYHQTQAMHPGS